MVFRREPANGRVSDSQIWRILLNRKVSDTVIIGAGPYGLSLAAQLHAAGEDLRIFGRPMQFWSNHMPRGMRLKSEGFASDLYDSGGRFPLKAYCAEKNIPYRDIGLPVRADTFIAYGLEFQRRYVPGLENTHVSSLSHDGSAFDIRTESGETLSAKRVVVAAGILHFAYIPPELQRLPAETVSHSSGHSDLGKFRGRRVAVLGAGAPSRRGGGGRPHCPPERHRVSRCARRAKAVVAKTASSTLRPRDRLAFALVYGCTAGISRHAALVSHPGGGAASRPRAMLVHSRRGGRAPTDACRRERDGRPGGQWASTTGVHAARPRRNADRRRSCRCRHRLSRRP